MFSGGLKDSMTKKTVNISTESDDLQIINDQCSTSKRNQSIDLYCKSIDWFLYDGEHWSLMG